MAEIGCFLLDGSAGPENECQKFAILTIFCCPLICVCIQYI